MTVPSPRRATKNALAPYALLLRGINLGGTRSLPMKDLVALCEAMGCADVRTYIQSGNVVVRARAEVAATLADDLAARIEERFGIAVPVILRSGAQLHEVIAGNPFVARGTDAATLHVAFLSTTPSEARVSSLDANRSPPDLFVVRGQEIYLACPDGLGRTKLTNAYFDRALETTSTVRNWRTVQTLEEMTRAT